MLRLVTLTVFAFMLGAPVAHAQSSALPSMESHGALIDRKLRDAKELGATLADRLEGIQKEFDLPPDLVDRALASLENGEVQEALGISPGFLADQNVSNARYPEGVFAFASFSMPDASLRALLAQGSELGIPVVFNGFVNNSVTDTEARVRQIYGDDPETSEVTHGFTIDPTLFKRFAIKAVPTLISTTQKLDTCLTPACDNDPIPPHDRVAGNIPLGSLLDIIAIGGSEHAAPAISRQEQRQ